MDISDKVVVVLGASSGIGEGIASVVASHHPQGLVLAARTKDKLEALASRFHRQYGIDTFVIPTDVGNTVELKNLIDRTVERYGHLDVFVNSAGLIQEAKPIEDMTEDELHRIIQTNFTQVLYAARGVSPRIKKQKEGGIIITISSRAGKLAYAGEAAYCATKAGVDHMTRALDEEYKLLRAKGIEVYAFALGPGFINTEEAKKRFPDAVSAIEQAPTPEDFGRLGVEYIQDPKKSYEKNGAVVHIDTAESF
jgi:NAD(P)-dependent dehydrogenase (short-subunit alcohol dehydrogenase family)